MQKWVKRVAIGLGMLSTVLLGGVAMIFSNLGQAPSDAQLQSFEDSPNFDRTRRKFKNRQDELYRSSMANFDYWALLKKQVFGKEQRQPLRPLPTVMPDWSDLRENELQYYWLGHSTTVLHITGSQGAKTLLFDPVLGGAAPVSFAVPRFQDPVVALSQLPQIDAVVISHDHYDHLSRESIAFFAEKTHFFVPLGVSSYLIGWGVSPDRITELDWWGEVEFEGLKLACTPSQHFSGRTGPRGNTTLWASWVVLGKEHRVYFSGDSGYDIHFTQIGEKYGPFDIGFLENGQYNPIWPMSHMFPKETVQAGVDLGAKVIQPIHWGVYKLSTHDWFDPIEQTWKFAAEQQVSVSAPKMGQLVNPNQPLQSDLWWRDPLLNQK